MSIRLSVIVPVTPNRLQNLELCLHSLKLQTFQEFETIVVNDGGDNSVIDVLEKFSTDLDIRYIWSRKYQPFIDTQARNKGARLARYPFYVFVDCDIILQRDALNYYIEDIESNPNRIIAGIYHWLTPMQITPDDIGNRFMDILNEKLPRLPIDSPRSHNICRDMRMWMFEATPDQTFHDVAHRLGTFTGNICYPKDIFWKSGGFWDELIGGIGEDGCLGLAAYYAGYSVSYDKRILGGHLYHTRDIKWVLEQTPIAIKQMEKRFRIGEYADNIDLESTELRRPVWDIKI